VICDAVVMNSQMNFAYLHTCDGTAPQSIGMHLNNDGFDHFLGQGAESLSSLMPLTMSMQGLLTMMMPLTMWAIVVATVIPAAALVAC